MDMEIIPAVEQVLGKTFASLFDRGDIVCRLLIISNNYNLPSCLQIKAISAKEHVSLARRFCYVENLL